MRITVIGDFADPMSFLASQRVAQLSSLGCCDWTWLAVEADPLRTLPELPLAADAAAQAAALALPGESVPQPGDPVPNSRAATAAYAESVTDNAAEAMRYALFDAAWIARDHVDEPEVIRSVAFAVLNPQALAGDVDERIRTNRSITYSGDPDPLRDTRRRGYLVSRVGGPLTNAGQERIDGWRRLWRGLGRPQLPVLVTDAGVIADGSQALEWLAERLPHGRTQAATVSSQPA
jgi:hypothetical protein